MRYMAILPVPAIIPVAAALLLGFASTACCRQPSTKVRFVNCLASDLLLDVTAQETTLDKKPRKIAKLAAYTVTTRLKRFKHPGQVEWKVSSGTQPVETATLAIPPGMNTAVFGMHSVGTKSMDLAMLTWDPEQLEKSGLISIVNAIPDAGQIDVHLVAAEGAIMGDFVIPYQGNYNGRWSQAVDLELRDHATNQLLLQTTINPVPRENQMLIMMGTVFAGDSYPVVSRVITNKTKK